MRIKDNTVVITGADLSPGHEYEVMVQSVSSDGRIQSVEDSPKAVIVLKGKEFLPSQPSGLSATGGLAKIALSWDVQTDKDFDVMEIWRSSTDNVGVAAKVAEVKTTSWTDEIGSTGQTRYYWLIARNTSGKTSSRYPSTSGVSATTTGISPTNIDDFAIDATKLFTNTIILTADVWSNNTPVVGQITWNTHYLVYGGAYYRVTGSFAALRYIYWDVGHTAGSGTIADPYITTYSNSATYTAASDRFVVVVNESGIVQKVWNASANMVIGSAFIMDAAIINAKIDTMTASKLTAGTIDASVITVTNLNASNISTGTLLARPVKSATSGARVEIFPDVNTGIAVYDAGGGSVFSAIVGGASIGDVIIGYLPGGSGMRWDNSESKLTIAGIMTISAGSTGIANTDVGALGLKDTIAAIDCDSTIISGGKIITGLLTATNIQTGTLTGLVVQTASGTGKRIVLQVSDNTLRMYNQNNVNILTIDDNFGSRPGIKITDSTYGGKFEVYKDSNTWSALYEDALYISDAGTYQFQTEDGITNTKVSFKVNGTQVVGAQGAAVANATDAASVILRLNDLLARCRAHGLIAT